MMIIFWYEDGVLLTEYLPRGSTINGPCCASIIERLRSVILENRRGKVSRRVLLLHDNVPTRKCEIVQATIRQAVFIELNYPADAPDIASSDCHLLSNLKKFLRGKNFSSDDKAITTVEHYLTDLNSEFFFIKAYKICITAGSVWSLARSVHSINAIIICPRFNSI